MKITWHGQACFTIEHAGVTIITDPVDPKYGVSLPDNAKADIVTVSHSHDDHSYIKGVETPSVFDWPGEYEVKDVAIQGIHTLHYSKNDESADPARGDNIIFVFHFFDFTICHLGDLGHSIPSKMLEDIGDVDILMTPVGGKYSLDAKKAEKVVSSIEPRVVIPMHYAVPGLTIEGLSGVAPFLQEMGATGIEPLPSYSPKKTDMDTEKTQIILLEPTK